MCERECNEPDDCKEVRIIIGIMTMFYLKSSFPFSLVKIKCLGRGKVIKKTKKKHSYFIRYPVGKKNVCVLGCYDIVEKNHEAHLLLESYFQGKYVEILILA